MRLFSSPPVKPLFALVACLCACVLPSARGASSAVTVSTFRINNGEMITRSGTVALTMSATSTVGKVVWMQVGDSDTNVFGSLQPYKPNMTYVVSGTSTGWKLIAALFIDNKGNISKQASAVIHVIPDFPVSAGLTSGSAVFMAIRHNRMSSSPLTPAVNDPADPVVHISTAEGDILLKLTPSKAPLTVANFLRYVDGNSYDNTIFHRSEQDQPPYIIQSGGYVIDSSGTLPHIQTLGTVVNEYNDPNTRGTIAMAKLAGDPDSATSEWYINNQDNSDTLGADNDGGFTVFGTVLDATMPVVDAIASLTTGTVGMFTQLPVLQVPSDWNSVSFSDLVTNYFASRFNFFVTKQTPGVKATVQNNYLVLQPEGKLLSGTGTITVRGVSQDGRFLDFPVTVDIGTDHPLLNKGVSTKSVTTTEDKPVDIPFSVTAPTGALLVWNTSTPTSGSAVLQPQVKPTTRTVRYTPNLNFSGTDSFAVLLTETNSNVQKIGTDTLTISVTVKPVNDLPTVTAQSTFSVQGGHTASFDVTVNDVETPAPNLVLTSVIGGSLFPKGTVVLSGSTATRTVQLSPKATTKTATATLTLTVTGANKGKGTAKVVVTVTP